MTSRAQPDSKKLKIPFFEITTNQENLLNWQQKEKPKAIDPPKPTLSSKVQVS